VSAVRALLENLRPTTAVNEAPCWYDDRHNVPTCGSIVGLVGMMATPKYESAGDAAGDDDAAGDGDGDAEDEGDAGEEKVLPEEWSCS